MRIAESSLDDLLSETVEALRRSGLEVEPTKGAARELIGVTLELSNPRSRLSVTESRGLVFSCLGEFLWYASGSNALDHIQYYIPRYDEFSDDGAILNGAYGPRLFAGGSDSQVATVVELLRRKPSSRQAVLQIFGAEDLLKESKDIPCTCILQFLVREGRLHLVVMMRVASLVGQIERPIASAKADAAYDTGDVYKTLEHHRAHRSPKVLIPPRKGARLRGHATAES